jgi:Cofilin/tropomyosin-type actin-binding protein
VKAQGNGGLDELKEQLEDDQVHYGYLRVTSGDSESKRAKFVFISWVGERVGPLKRAKVSVHKASVKQIIQVCILIFHLFS